MTRNYVYVAKWADSCLDWVRVPFDAITDLEWSNQSFDGKGTGCVWGLYGKINTHQILAEDKDKWYESQQEESKAMRVFISREYNSKVEYDELFQKAKK